MNTTSLQKAINQIGLEAVKKSLVPYGNVLIGFCDVHGSYAYKDDNHGLCPLCPRLDNQGDTAEKVEHYINVNPIQDLKNPQQKLNPHGV